MPTPTELMLMLSGRGVEKTMCIQDVCEASSILQVKPILVGGSSDGASVNVSQHNSLRAQLYWRVYRGSFGVGATYIA